MDRLLPQEIETPTPEMERLTARMVLPIQPQLMVYLAEVRAQVDAELQPALRPVSPVKPYPLGRCEEITRAAMAILGRRLREPAHPVEHALASFLRQGGRIRTIWGALRGTYFQNAFQIGSLYADVANDTVVVTKPKVEILPVQECGLVPIRDIAHFIEIAGKYWGGEIYPNLVIPDLAPLFPMISRVPHQSVRPQMGCDYMIDLFRRDEFRGPEAFLATAPPPPPEVVDELRGLCPETIRHVTPDSGRDLAVAACRRARDIRADDAWRDRLVLDLLSIRRL
ncbi:hypothetical protein VPG91_19395 [Nitrospirillum amazonense]|uniref:hypothetical protein n=1 Tax=Nitrospirillum amazonense TaxID=28077 RepID=UPI002DD41C39|nr:hypothetical protein [Nitrospirillum amazonense]MEC4593179.1 hypothetical protein [Nitrospirillum amazonense]